ncbi:phosphoribosylformylglycinamidine synthase subunit PurL [Pelodictyon luteolum]|uniref:Phosphoribosylformylglycinamidine synthase subunit PurL n=1 Tax=Chlorobium luteolum (strain DSM 273 / BCRC 81028 / 2530) TaxID=319225 RepID=PURL_CHLL3|nr:phosphoribosylformylglycinamidine synthase subunit PurL [Pelodictyon luteolum]Q3B3Y0.1 RecName: Full=Phosphoribosylformylglycinamidine synthase subunit PurL; Short=FGAM synthase; AltName: Full=Formylglycinamide ribonucleotide amidotransferase subunit II; Short=FGAR amidotransferase II; Short=FGAR-AT II; AltName: Full=Glutamine amidotransferase PurL; AltName: Full=Phosphoribosylformylglycinamidine synthase subunit II [Pelodictyon luteolum DSM 273]ABB23951.1 phosphoribosylformylglycinamidine syn
MKTIEPEVNLALAAEHGLNAEEYQKIQEVLGRTPTFTELGIFSVMWSEHCSYKNSIAVLKTLPREGEALLTGAGEENAGLVDIGDNLAVAFKIESHNHPSAVEPYQGAATGVGGIHRDIFTMGARPVASLNSLRFGSPKDPRVRYLVDGVVRGIGDYGNSFGVPTVGGEIYFEDCYTGNPLVNAMSVGIVEHHKTVSATAEGEGNPVLIVGSSTGRDGIHGATFASEDLSEASEDKRPSVQVGDPFAEKLLLEATLEAIATGYVAGLQDMGAAGITSSTSEMSARGIEKNGNGGITIDLDLVPAREAGMSAYEIMLSESQERMLIVAEKGHEDDIIAVYRKWDVQAVVVGTVTSDNHVKVLHHGELVADIPAESLVLGGGAPVYIREAVGKKPDTAPAALLPDAGLDLRALALELLKRPNIASKRWVYRQYDSMVQTNTVTPVGHTDAAVIRIRGTKKGLAMKTDCNSRYVYLNPLAGGRIAVAECARNIACSGARPLAITNCLNFGNPYKPEVYFQFKTSVQGMGDACRAFNTPVTGGNVSFYNESTHGGGRAAIYPTPTIGMIGLLDDIDNLVGSAFTTAGDAIILFGDPLLKLEGSEFQVMQYGTPGTDAPDIDLQHEKNLQDLLVTLAEQKLLHSAHDVSDGGLFVTLAEKAIMDESRQLGFQVDLEDCGSGPYRVQEQLFSEAQGRVVGTIAPDAARAVIEEAIRHSVPVRVIGQVVPADASLAVDGHETLRFTTEELTAAYYDALENALHLNELL